MWFKRREVTASIPSISKLTVGPEDILVFTIPEGPPAQFDEHVRRIGEVIAQTKAIDRNRVWVVPANMKISIISPGTPAYRLTVGKRLP